MVRFDQVAGGKPVYGHALGVNVDAEGRVRCAHGQFRPGIDFAAIPDALAPGAADRIRSAGRVLHAGATSHPS